MKNKIVMIVVAIAGITAITLSYYFSYLWFISLGFNFFISVLFSTFSVTSASVFWVLHKNKNKESGNEKDRPTVYGGFAVFFIAFSIFCSMAGQLEKFDNKVEQKVLEVTGGQQIADTTDIDWEIQNTKQQIEANSDIIIKLQADSLNNQGITYSEQQQKRHALWTADDNYKTLSFKLEKLRLEKAEFIKSFKVEIISKKSELKNEDNRFSFLANIFHLPVNIVKMVITLLPSVLIDLTHPECFQIIIFGKIFSTKPTTTTEKKKPTKKRKKLRFYKEKIKIADPLTTCKIYTELRLQDYEVRNRQLNSHQFVISGSKLDNDTCIQLSKIAIEEGLISTKGSIHFAKPGIDEKFFFKKIYEKYKMTIDKTNNLL